MSGRLTEAFWYYAYETFSKIVMFHENVDKKERNIEI